MGVIDYNLVVVMGRLTADPKSDKVPSGMTRTTFSIANNYFSPSGNGVNFFDVVCFGKLAETSSTYLKKGKLILVSGSLRYSKWNDKKTGMPRTKISIFMKELKMLGGKKEEENPFPRSTVPDDDPSMQPPDSDEVPF